MPSNPPNPPPSHWWFPKKTTTKKPWVILISILLTLLFQSIYLTLLYFGLLHSPKSTFHPTPKKPNDIYEITLTPPPQPNFVDTNPFIDPQEPPETNNYAAKSQKAAQEIPLAQNQLSDIPILDGDMEEILKIVPDILPNTEILEITETQPDPNPFETPPQQLNKDPQPSNPGTRTRPKPKPRQRITKPLVGGMRKNQTSTNNVGVSAVDAKFNQFGLYRQKMNEAIGYQWFLLLSNYCPSNEDFSTKVQISYTIDTSGTVTNLQVQDTSASSLLTMLCKDSILSIGSFGPWTDEMIQTLGKEQTFHVGFIIR